MLRLTVLILALVLSIGTASARCSDPGSVDVPIGFGVSSDELMDQSDITIAYFVMGTIDGTLKSAMIGADRACIDQLVACTHGRTAESIAAAFRRTVIAVPANRAQPASQVIFNLAFGDCFRTFVEGQPT